MSKVCDITGKRPRSWNNRSHSMRKSKRWFRPNIFKKWLTMADGTKVRIKICSKVFKKLQKEGVI